MRTLIITIRIKTSGRKSRMMEAVAIFWKAMREIKRVFVIRKDK
jgi:hypothetical protein